MSININGIPIICVEDDSKCELCGTVAECRPYGPKGEQICFTCGQKDKATTMRRLNQVLFGDSDDRQPS